MRVAKLIRPGETRLDERPATPDPMAVATVDEFVCAARKPTLRGILPRREPRDEPWNV
jgi:hypothetical protein